MLLTDTDPPQVLRSRTIFTVHHLANYCENPLAAGKEISADSIVSVLLVFMVMTNRLFIVRGMVLYQNC